MSHHHKVAEIKKALETYHGCVHLAAESLGVWPSAVYARIKKSPELQELVDSFSGRLVDFAELKLEQAVRNGDRWAVLFTLRTKGRHRGYVEKKEIETNGHLHYETTPHVGPELDKAISRVLGVLETGRETSPSCPGDELPEGFRAPD